MSPIMEADFDWLGNTQASTPVFSKGEYELTIKSIRGQAWPKTDDSGNATGVITQKIALKPEMVGTFDSKGKLVGEQEGKVIKGIGCEDINFWMHSDGGKKMSKRQIMAILGYNPNNEQDEADFNAFIVKSKLDFSVKPVENDDGDGYVLVLGEGWNKLVGQSVRSIMEPETRKRGDEEVVQQNYKSLSPVNK
jgi:hypothetical protein